MVGGVSADFMVVTRRSRVVGKVSLDSVAVHEGERCCGVWGVHRFRGCTRRHVNVAGVSADSVAARRGVVVRAEPAGCVEVRRCSV